MTPEGPRSTPLTLLEDQTYTIETPEHVRIVYRVAGPGSRLMAALVDFLIMIVPSLLALLIVIFALVAAVEREAIEEMMEGRTGPKEELVVFLAFALFSMVQFAVMWFYFVIFEVASNGQSPGKRMLDIRVIGDGGQPVGLFTSMIRNLIRLVDFFPLFYLVGFVTMLASRHWRRLGDLAAGTLVVVEDTTAGRDLVRSMARENPGTEVGMTWTPGSRIGPGIDPGLDERLREGRLHVLDPAFQQLASRFLDRRWQLEESVATHLAERIARPMMERLGMDRTDPLRFIEDAMRWSREQAGKGR